jgi:hypothetical protein
MPVISPVGATLDQYRREGQCSEQFGGKTSFWSIHRKNAAIDLFSNTYQQTEQ